MNFNLKASQGYELNAGKTGCIDIDECAIYYIDTICADANFQYCENTIGSYQCLPNHLPMISIPEVKRPGFIRKINDIIALKF